MKDSKTNSRRKFAVKDMPDLQSLVASVQNNANRAGQADIFEKKVLPQMVNALERVVQSNMDSKGDMARLNKEMSHLVSRFISQIEKLNPKEPTVNFTPPPTPTAPINIEAKLPPIEFPTPEITINQEGSRKWEFTIHREDNGLIRSVTAERMA